MIVSLTIVLVAVFIIGFIIGMYFEQSGPDGQ